MVPFAYIIIITPCPVRVKGLGGSLQSAISSVTVTRVEVSVGEDLMVRLTATGGVDNGNPHQSWERR